MKKTCHIIGVLDNGAAGLTPKSLQLIMEADAIVGGQRTLTLFKSQMAPGAIQHDLSGQLIQLPQWIQQALDKQQRVVVLATGDPLCHGIGQFLLAKLGKDICHIIPNISTIQLACARLGIAWQEVTICSVHSHDAGEWFQGAGPDHGLYVLLHRIKQHHTIAVFTSPENSPDRIARMLQIEGLADYCDMSVVANLLQDNESISENLSIDEAAQQTFPVLNICLIQRQDSQLPCLLGLHDSSFHQRKPDKGLITKREVRAVSLASLQLRKNSIVWDIGAGSGSVGLEAARLCCDGYVYAIEKNAGDYENARRNQQEMQISNYSLLHAKAPVGLENWQAPDAVFVGGSGGELQEIITLVLQRLHQGGRLVMNFVTLENMSIATQTLKDLQADWSFIQLNVSRSQPILNMHRLAAENPVWIVTAQCHEN